ncbi:MAG TPA: PilC/PilY family type IV pilus protein [Thermoanaerobaculia bacterium]|nr:PilC/PilY family type IV pilus protein [Thermoanaerobaculia bacterium]
MRHRTHAPRRPAPPRHRRLNAAAGVAALGLVAALLSPAAADDRDLLRFDSAKPYLFIVLDTSASMAMKMGRDEWAPGGADGPDSRLYQAKQALFNVLREVDDVHFGFAGFNQDGVHAVAKHWLYYNEVPLPDASQWPIAFPRADTQDLDADGSRLTRLVAIPRVDADGDPIPFDPSDTNAPQRDTRVSEIGVFDADGDLVAEADLLTFGPPFPPTVVGGRVVAGTCAAPLDLADPGERDRVESLAISPAGSTPTWFWIAGNGNTRFLLSIERPGNRPEVDSAGNPLPNAQLGQDNLHVLFRLRRLTGCTTADPFAAAVNFTLRRNLRLDTELNQFFYVNQETWAPGEGSESTMALWEHSDVVSRARFENHPHTGFGWEGNFDSGFLTDDSAFNDAVIASNFFEADYCLPVGDPDCVPLAAAARVKPTQQTVVGPGGGGRALEMGDMIPFDWTFTRRNELLTRLDPEFDSGLSTLGDFRVARHFGNAPVGGALPLLDADVPLVAADVSPLARALTDVRCWYLGSTGQGSNKCRESTFGGQNERFSEGWSQIACAKDTSFGCRRNFLIVIGDGEDNVAGQDANGSVGNLKNSANMVTWALNVGNPRGCNSGGGLHSIVRAGGGECVNVESQEHLRQVLEALLGQIRTTARSFASAAVPSVQATVEQKIFLTSFLPFNDTPVWKGSVHAFLKPLPVSSAGIPLTEQKCDGTGAISTDDPTQGCHLWDAGEILLEKQVPADDGDPATPVDFLDLADVARRRVFYARQPDEAGEWPLNMRLFEPLSIAAPNSRSTRFDLWRALGLSFAGDDSSSLNTAAQNEANAVIDFALRVKTGTERNTDVDPPLEVTHELVLGDIFHSTPVVIGTPANTLFFATDLYGNGAECDPDDGTVAANPGYRCFFEKQRFRRKMLLVGSNDGMLHAFDAGMFRTQGEDHWTGAPLVDDALNPFGSFDNGTGKELFAFVPRTVLPTLREMRTGGRHRFNVDGTVTVADVFVDPLRQASSTFPEETDREWRTVVIGGLREGGRGYYALDVTQPDPVELDPDEDLFFPTTADSGSNHPDSGDFVPECTAGLTAGDAGILAPPTDDGCGEVPFPSVMWEFTDTHFDPATNRVWIADEEPPQEITVGGVSILDLNGIGNRRPDLGDTWSTPNVGRIRLCRTGGTRCDPTPDPTTPDADDDLVDVFVAVVGGGMDSFNLARDWREGQPVNRAANWLYMIDVETGEAIYKRELDGAAPSEPAAVDTNGDGYLDRIYVGTLAGFLYRVDLEPVVAAGEDSLPALQLELVNHFDPTAGPFDPDESRTFPKARVPPTVWQPVKVFDTHFDGATARPLGTPPRPIFQRPSVIFQAGSGDFVLAFGTGDRNDLWSVPDPLPEERFYVFVDRFETTDEARSEGAMNESTLAPIDPLTSPATASNLLVTSGGWVMRLAPTERVITDAFALSGVTVFSTFVPRIEGGDGDPLVVGCEVDEESQVCSKQGVSHVFVVNTTNGNGLLFEGDSEVATRFNVAPTFVTNPFAEPGQTKDAVAGNEDGEHTADDLSANMVRVMESLKELFPPQCKFANYRIDIKTVAADTSLQFIAPIPVCLIESNWKEF